MTLLKPKNQHSEYRQRGYHCDNCDVRTLVFGNDKEPIACPNCESLKIKIEFDHLVTQVVTVKEFKDKL